MKRVSIILFLVMFCCTSTPISAEAAELRAGIGVSDITPPLGYRMSGYFRERLSTGIHDPLHAKAIVFQQGYQSAALVFCDISKISPDVSRHARERASEKTGIPASNILVAATHSHTGPLYFGALRNHFHDLAVAKHGKDPHDEIDYPGVLVEKVVDAVAAAHATARPVRVETGTAQQLGLSFNRRFHMKDGSVRMNPGKLNPDIVRPAGPIDPEVGILLIRDADTRRAFASLSVFALHLDTVSGTEYSADYPYYLEQSLREVLGAGFVSLFGIGTCGDINHYDVSDDRRQKGHEEAERIGTTLGETIRAALPGLKTVENPLLAASRATVDAPLQQYSPEQVVQARRDMANVANPDWPRNKRVEAFKILDLQLREGTRLPIEIQVFRLSDEVAIVGLPGEIFVELGLAIKQASPFTTTLVVELANDAPGYIPTKKAFGEGSYETVNSGVRSGSGEMLIDAAVRLLQGLAS